MWVLYLDCIVRMKMEWVIWKTFQAYRWSSNLLSKKSLVIVRAGRLMERLWVMCCFDWDGLWRGISVRYPQNFTEKGTMSEEKRAGTKTDSTIMRHDISMVISDDWNFCWAEEPGCSGWLCLSFLWFFPDPHGEIPRSTSFFLLQLYYHSSSTLFLKGYRPFHHQNREIDLISLQ